MENVVKYCKGENREGQCPQPTGIKKKEKKNVYLGDLDCPGGQGWWRQKAH